MDDNTDECPVLYSSTTIKYAFPASRARCNGFAEKTQSRAAHMSNTRPPPRYINTEINNNV